MFSLDVFHPDFFETSAAPALMDFTKQAWILEWANGQPWTTFKTFG